MVEEQLRGRDITDERVLAAMRRVPRHAFVPARARSLAYGDHPLAIGHGQTISQPYVVALMTQLLQLDGSERLLEVGTGSGYQAAVLAELARIVYSIEIDPRLAATAQKRLGELGYQNVQVRAGDGFFGWPEAAPFDAIIITAAAPRVPDRLVAQLRDGGRLVLPVGAPHEQQLVVGIKRGEQLELQVVGSVLFVPMTGAIAGPPQPSRPSPTTDSGATPSP
jgi:protein-L-isoaspartate(D-aspartate) O-methyltransferase